MQNRRIVTIAAVVVALTLLLAASYTTAGPPVEEGELKALAPVSTAFTYQGRLTDDGNPANGTHDFQFELYDDAGGGSQVGSTVTKDNVTVTDGLFAVELDFGSNVFRRGDARWLEIGVRPGSSTGGYTRLTPRHALTAVPYALYALFADTTYLQRRVTDSCTGGNAIRVINEDGSVTCEPVAVGGPHDHWGETWSGSGVGLTLSSNNGVGVKGYSTNKDGVVGETSASDKSGVWGHSTAGFGVTGTSDTNAGVQGLSTDGAGGLFKSINGNGVYVDSPGGHGVKVDSPGWDGVRVDSPGGYGVVVDSPRYVGVVVNSPGTYGVDVDSPGYDGVVVTSPGTEGVRVVAAGRHGVYVSNSGGDGVSVYGAGWNGLRIAGSIGGDYIRAGSDADLDFRGTNDGTAYADGGWQGAADFAELMSTQGDPAAYQPGDVLIISVESDRSVALSSESYSTMVIGIYSEKPGFVGSPHVMEGQGDDQIVVAIVGIVPCKVSAENGPISRGDLLVTSSTTGHAMRADNPPPGTILGKALGELESGTGVIDVLVTLQ